MADVRCPMCGKPNPADAETCRYCQARLKPLNASPFGSSDDRDVPDWLTSLRGPDEPAEEFAMNGESTSGGDANDESPDWLSRLGGQEKVEPQTPAFEGSGGEEGADWLAGLGGFEERLPGGGESGSQAPVSSEPEPAAPAWGTEPAGGEAEGSLDNWLSSLKDEETTAPQEPAAADWQGSGEGAAKAFDFGAAEPAAPAWGAEPAGGEAEGSLDNWLSSLKGEETAAPQEPAAADWQGSGEGAAKAFDFGAAEPAAPAWGTEPAGGEAEGSLDNWLSSLKGEETAAPQEPAAADWLGSGEGVAKAFDFGEPEPTSAAEPAAPGEMPDWLSGLAGGAQETVQEPTSAEPVAGEPPAAEAGEMPDWLSALKGEESPAAQEPAAADWLGSGDSSARDLSFGAAEPMSTAEPAVPGGMPDWLSGLAGGAQETVQEPTAVEPAAGEPAEAEAAGEMPDWLSSLKGGETPAAQEPAAFDWSEGGAQAAPFALSEEEPAEPAGAMPDWLSGLSGSQPEAAAEPVAAEPAAGEPAEAAGGMPDWLSSLTGAETPAAPAGEALDWLSGESQAQPTGTPDWLAAEPQAFGAFEPETPEPAGPAAAEPAEESQGVPDWLSQIDQTQAAPASSSVPAFTMDEGMEPLELGGQEPQPDATEMALSVPDWISQVSAESAPEAAAPAGAGEAEANLAQANLPDWLEAMRPVESLAPDSAFQDRSDDRLEKAGPLAGLRGVIPVEASALELRKPPAYSLKIPIADDQQARLNILQELLGAEGSVVSQPARAVISSQLVLRLVVFALLVLASIVALWNGPQTPLPAADRISPEVAAVKQHVDSIVAGRPVLLVMDYEPGFSDEMNALAMPVLDHLAAQGAYLTFISTSPTGPVMAAGLVEWLNLQPAFAQAGFTNYANLGYLPGGVNGIRAFAQAPAQTLPYKLDGNPAWTGTPLDGKQGLNGFALVVVVSDDPEGARQWIEQVGPQLQGKVPFVFLTSAQAGPVVQTYYAAQTGLVTGLVSGIAGGAAYHSLTARAGTVQQYWDAFSLALNVMVVVIVLGGLYSLGTGMLPQRKVKKGEENA